MANVMLRNPCFIFFFFFFFFFSLYFFFTKALYRFIFDSRSESNPLLKDEHYFMYKLFYFLDTQSPAWNMCHETLYVGAGVMLSGHRFPPLVICS